MRKGLTDEELFFELALEDLTRAADLFLPVHERTAGVDGFVSLEVSPLLAYDTQATIAEAKRLHRQGRQAEPLHQDPRHAGRPARHRGGDFAGVPVNVTLLFSTADYLAAAEAYMRGIERRIEAGLDPDVRSVASVFISRWDRAIVEKVPDELKNQLGIAVGQHAYRAYRDLIASDRWQRLRTPARGRSGSCSPAPRARTSAPPTRCTSKRSPRPIRSTPCRRRRCAPSPTTALSTAC